MKHTILLRDKNFCSSNDYIVPSDHVNWEVDFDCNKNGKITVFTDHCLNTVDNCSSDYKIAWLLEPPAIVGFAYEYIVNNWQKFDYILTHSDILLSIDKKFIYCTCGGTSICESDRAVHPKRKMVSTIASNKKYVPGHFFRHEAIATVRDHKFFEVMGSGYRQIENKIEGLKDYQYSLTTENCRTGYYFSEKIIDCFLTGTVPIYWGSPHISEVFDSRGIICFETLDGPKRIFESLSYQDYQSRLEAVKNNFEIASKGHLNMDMNLWNFFFKDFIPKVYPE